MQAGVSGKSFASAYGGASRLYTPTCAKFNRRRGAFSDRYGPRQAKIFARVPCRDKEIAGDETSMKDGLIHKWAKFFDALKWPYDNNAGDFEWHGQVHAPDFVCLLPVPTLFTIKEKNEKDRGYIISEWHNLITHFVTPDRSFVLVFGRPWIDMNAYVAAWDKEQKVIGVHQNAFIGQCPCCVGPSLMWVTGRRQKNVVWHAPGFNKEPYKSAQR